ncbi:putative quorum-quenching lactonase YtnP [Phycisphaerales bacterium]|nr:putative quorum-quenching lactonase YtnP [Phycisphaerales bacterium]
MNESGLRYDWRLLRAGEFRLDGGSMFGLVPRVVWGRSVPTDDRGRISVHHNCLLLTANDGGGARRIVVETGSGDKADPKSRDIFALGERTIVSALREAGCDPGDINAVFVTHLHFDHSGGLTRLARPGESPEWTGPGWAGEVSVVRTFPNAKVFVQFREWQDALANRSVMTRTYFRDHLEPIKNHLSLIESPPPFPPGYIPARNEQPLSPVALRESAPYPGIGVFLAPGHTWGQQAIKFTDTKGRTVVFTPDVMPTMAHLGAAYSLSYDVEPYTSMVSRGWFLAEAAANDWLLVLDHEPNTPCVRVRANGKGWFELVAEPNERGTLGG